MLQGPANKLSTCRDAALPQRSNGLHDKLLPNACYTDFDPPQDHFENDPQSITRFMIAQNADELPGGVDLRPDLADQPEHVHNLLEQLEDHGLTEVAEEGPILYVVTWFLNHPHCDSCPDPWVLRLTGAFTLWQHQFLMVWSDRLEEGQPVDFTLFIRNLQPRACSLKSCHI